MSMPSGRSSDCCDAFAGSALRLVDRGLPPGA